MEIKYLQTFKTILSAGSFSKAAEKLNYTQSTITFQVQQLEQEFSVKLFEKIGRRMILTKAGEELLPYVDEVLRTLDKLEGFRGDILELRGELHIDMAETMLCYKMAPILKEFRRLAPNAKLYVRSLNCYEILDNLKSGKTDMGIFYRNVYEKEEMLKTYPMGEYTMSLVASPKVKEEYPDFISPYQDMKIPLIIDEPDCIFRQIFECYLKEHHITLDHTIELWSIPTIKNLVKSDVGISFLPSFTVADDIAGGDLCKIKTELDGETLNAVCAHHKNKWVSPIMELFISLVTNKMQGMGNR